MFFSLEQPVVISLIAIIAVQYAFATFCLLKLATLDVPRKNYVLWNLFILLVFFIGGIVFLVYYFKVKDTKRIPESVPTTESADDAETTAARAEDGETGKADEDPEAGDSDPDEPDGGVPDVIDLDTDKKDEDRHKGE